MAHNVGQSHPRPPWAGRLIRNGELDVGSTAVDVIQTSYRISGTNEYDEFFSSDDVIDDDDENECTR